jgi:hypothetical protein
VCFTLFHIKFDIIKFGSTHFFTYLTNFAMVGMAIYFALALIVSYRKVVGCERPIMNPYLYDALYIIVVTLPWLVTAMFFMKGTTCLLSHLDLMSTM